MCTNELIETEINNQKQGRCKMKNYLIKYRVSLINFVYEDTFKAESIDGALNVFRSQWEDGTIFHEEWEEYEIVEVKEV